MDRFIFSIYYGSFSGKAILNKYPEEFKNEEYIEIKIDCPHWFVRFDGQNHGPFSKAGALGLYRYLVIKAFQESTFKADYNQLVENNHDNFERMLDENDAWAIGYDELCESEQKIYLLEEVNGVFIADCDKASIVSPDMSN